MKLQGKVLNWNDDKGYGFVEPNGGGERAFVHVKAFQPGSRRPINGDVIVYELVYDNNRYKAENIKFSANVNTAIKNTLHPSRTRNVKNKTKNDSGFYSGCIVLFFLGLGGAVLTGQLSAIIIGLYFLFSFITFALYAIDKSAAQKGLWRKPESTLHFFSLIGGWPGAYCAQRLLRHKSSKEKFKRVFGITVLLNVCGLIWLHTDVGANLVDHIIDELFN